MESSFAFFILFSLVLFATTIEARKDPGEYWQGIMKDEPMPEAIQGLVYKDSVLPLSNKRRDCHTSSQARNINDHIVKDSQHVTEERYFVKDFEPRPNALGYDAGLKEDKYSFAKDFEPRFNVPYGADLEEDELFANLPNSQA